MKALIVLASPPLPEGGAPGKCAIGLLRGLASHGVDVTAVAAEQYFSGDLPAGLAVEVIPIPPPSRGLGSYPRRLRRPRGDLLRGPFLERVRELAPKVDVVHLEQTETAWCDEDLNTPSVVHVHNRILRDEALGPPWRSNFRRVAEHELAERAALRRHQYVLASSPLVAEYAKARAPHAIVVHAPLSVDPAYYEPSEFAGTPVAGLIGTASWPPTLSAMRRLVTRVWPEVRRKEPGARLVIGGRATDVLVDASGAPNVEIRGSVASAAAFLVELSVLVYPLDRGSGMKVKVLEALASGVPVVTTPAGAEGIEAGDGVIVAEDDAAIADATVAILTDGGERRERGAAARAAFEARYSPGPATAPVAELYEQMIE